MMRKRFFIGGMIAVLVFANAAANHCFAQDYTTNGYYNGGDSVEATPAAQSSPAYQYPSTTSQYSSTTSNDVTRLPSTASELSSSDSFDSTVNLNQIEPLSAETKDTKHKPPSMGFPGMGGGDGPSPIQYETFWFPETNVPNQNATFGMVGQKLSLTCPLWMSQPNMLMVMAGVQNRTITTDAVMPDTGLDYPDQLWNVSMGLMYMRQLQNGWTAGGGVNIGSASDHPFASGDRINVGVNAMLKMPRGDRDSWMFMLMYSPMSEINFPIPGVAYSYNPSDKLHFNIGLPLQVSYRPDEHWSFEASYMLIHTIHTKIAYKFTDRLSVFAGYDWSNEVYSLTENSNDDEHFYLYDQRVSMGLETPMTDWCRVSLTGGYVFDRYSYQGEQWDSTQYDRVDMDPGAFMSLSISLRR